MICVEPGRHNYSGSIYKMEIYVQRERKERRKKRKQKERKGERRNMEGVSLLTSQPNTLQNILFQYFLNFREFISYMLSQDTVSHL